MLKGQHLKYMNQEIPFSKSIKQIKHKPLYKKEIGSKNNVTITTNNGKEIYKFHLENFPSILG